MDMVRASFNRKVPMGSAARNRDSIDSKGQRERDACPGQQRFQVIGTPPRSIGGNEFGDGGLVAGSCQGKGERQCGTEQLIDPHSFFSEEPGQVDPVEKTDDAGDKTGDRQNQSTEDQRMTFGHAS